MGNGSSGNSELAGLSLDQATVLQGLSTILSAIASLDPDPYSSGAFTVISAVIKLGALFGPDPIVSEIGQLAQKIYDIYIELGAVEAADQIQTRKTFLDQTVTDASSALNDLQNAIDNPAVYSPGSLILQCQTVLNKFAIKDNLIWNITYLVAEYERIYWDDSGQYQSTCYYLQVSGSTDANPDDAGYRLQTPPLNSDNVTVFEYRLTLPLYLWALSVFLVVGRALYKQFVADRKDDLVQARDTLQWVYNKILANGNGLTPLFPPDWTSSSLRNTACPLPVDGAPPLRPALRLKYGTWNRHDPSQPFPPISGVVIEYGAVEKYSGDSSMGDNYEIDFKNPNDSQNPAFLNKVQVRSLKRTRDVYVSCGLLTVWQTINQLNALIGDPPLSSSTFQWPDGSAIDLVCWSCRQIFHLAKMTPSASGYSLRALGKFLIETPPLDTPYSAGATSLSLTTLLTNFTD